MSSPVVTAPRHGSPVYAKILWLSSALLLLVTVAQYNYLLFHSLVELFSIVIAFGIFQIAWAGREHYHHDYLLFIGIAYLFIALFDTLHTLGYHGMSVFSDIPGYNLGPQLWLVGRMMEACTLMVAPLFIRRPLHRGLTFSVYAAISIMALWSIFGARNFPTCFAPESGLTSFKIVAEYVIIAVLLVALALLVRYRTDFDRRVYRLLLGSLLLTAASELCFTLYISHYGASNLLGHLFKIVSFSLVYYAIIETALRRPFALLFRDLKERQDGMLAAQRAARLGSWSCRPGSAEMNWTPGVFEQLGLVAEGTRMTVENFYAALAEPERRVLAGAMEELRRDGRSFRLELSRPAADGTIRYLQFKGARTENESGEPLLAGVVQDITERITTEQLREDIDRIARHDLRSPLTPIIGFSQFMVERSDNLSDDQREMLKDIHQSGMKMLGMLNSSLTLYKIERGTYQLQSDWFDLFDVLREVMRELDEKLKTSKVDCRILFGERSPQPLDELPCFGEVFLCCSLFANLIGNAIEASPPGGQVTITVTGEGGELRVAIHNRGAVPEAIRAHFFDKYTTHGKRGGTGLGTYSALLVARAHGGTIHLETDEESTTVTVVLPQSPAP